MEVIDSSGDESRQSAVSAQALRLVRIGQDFKGVVDSLPAEVRAPYVDAHNASRERRARNAAALALHEGRY